MKKNSGNQDLPRFKVGDKVKCIQGSYGVKVGGVYTVTESYRRHSESSWLVDTDAEKLLFESRFVPAKETNIIKLLKAIDES